MGSAPQAVFAASLVLLGLLAGKAGAAAAEDLSSHTILGPSNPLLSEGALALEAGHAQEGLEKTLAGLREPSSPHDTAAGHSNACAALVLLGQLDAALEHCNTAIGLDASNWHSYNNRAAVYAARGLYELAIEDLQTALSIAPHARQLQQSLEIALRNKRILHQRDRGALAS